LKPSQHYKSLVTSILNDLTLCSEDRHAPPTKKKKDEEEEEEEDLNDANYDEVSVGKIVSFLRPESYDRDL